LNRSWAQPLSYHLRGRRIIASPSGETRPGVDRDRRLQVLLHLISGPLIVEAVVAAACPFLGHFGSGWSTATAPCTPLGNQRLPQRPYLIFTSSMMGFSPAITGLSSASLKDPTVPFTSGSISAPAPFGTAQSPPSSSGLPTCDRVRGSS